MTATSTRTEMFSHLSERREQRGMYGNAVISDVRGEKKQSRQSLRGRSCEFLTKAAGLLKVGGLKSRRSILETSSLNGFKPVGMRTDQWACSEGEQAVGTSKQLNTRHTGGFSVLWTGFGRLGLDAAGPEEWILGCCSHQKGLSLLTVTTVVLWWWKKGDWLLLNVTEFIESRRGVYSQNCVLGGQFESRGFPRHSRSRDKSINLAVCVNSNNMAYEPELWDTTRVSS